MQPLPHTYRAHAEGETTGALSVRSESLPDLPTHAPAEFDGPGDQWSPETLLTAAVASCLILTFRVIAKASRFEWNALRCDVEATLGKGQGGARFTSFVLRAEIEIPKGADQARALRLLEKAKGGCIVTNSLAGESTLEVTVTASPSTS